MSGQHHDNLHHGLVREGGQAMKMHCIRCGRAILRPESAVTMPAGVGVGRVSGPVAWGPRCAIIAGLVKPPKPRVITGSRRRPVLRASGPGQIDWVAEAGSMP